MDNDLDMEELEQEQLDYLRRNYDKTSNIPNTSDMNLDILEKPIDDRIVLTPDQEKKLVEEIMKRQRMNENPPRPKKDHSFSLTKYFDALSESFVDIMDDLLNFDGNLEKLPNIFTKDDRLILVGTVILIISLIFIWSKQQA